jgi:rubredoxin
VFFAHLLEHPNQLYPMAYTLYYESLPLYWTCPAAAARTGLLMLPKTSRTVYQVL